MDCKSCSDSGFVEIAGLPIYCDRCAHGRNQQRRANDITTYTLMGMAFIAGICCGYLLT